MARADLLTTAVKRGIIHCLGLVVSKAHLVRTSCYGDLGPTVMNRSSSLTIIDPITMQITTIVRSSSMILDAQIEKHNYPMRSTFGRNHNEWPDASHCLQVL